MTRVNILSPRRLTDQHLIAERLELTWVLSSAKRSLESKHGLATHPTYTLGKGHISFFHDKLGYIRDRFNELTEEMVARGMQPKMSWPDDSWVPQDMKKSYTPTPAAVDIIIGRIKQRLLMKPTWYKYFGNPIDLDWIAYRYGT
jgi:deoxyribonuclease (pyrimidine dimer)